MQMRLGALLRAITVVTMLKVRKVETKSPSCAGCHAPSCHAPAFCLAGAGKQKLRVFVV
jgi:hypothetical protein